MAGPHWAEKQCACDRVAWSCGTLLCMPTDDERSKCVEGLKKVADAAAARVRHNHIWEDSAKQRVTDALEEVAGELASKGGTAGLAGTWRVVSFGQGLALNIPDGPSGVVIKEGRGQKNLATKGPLIVLGLNREGSIGASARPGYREDFSEPALLAVEGSLDPENFDKKDIWRLVAAATALL